MQQYFDNFGLHHLAAKHLIQPGLRRGFRLGLTGSDDDSLGVQLKRSVKVKPGNQILARLRPRFRQQQLHQERRAENLLEIRFQLRTQTETEQPAQAHILWRAIEGFEVCRVDCRLSDFFDVGWMPQPGQRVPVEQFKHLGMAGAHTEQ